VCLVPALLAFRSAGPSATLALGWLWSVLLAYGVGDWMPAAIVDYYRQSPAVGWAFFFAVSTLMATPYHLAFLFAWRALASASDRGRLARPALPLLAACAWCAGELLRARLFTGTSAFIGNPWGLLGYSQVGWPALVQIAAITGIYGVGFAVASANVAIAEALRALTCGRRARGALALCAAGMLPGLAVVAYGAWVLGPEGESAARAAPERRVAIVQAAADADSRWQPDHYGRHLDLYLALTNAAIRRAAPRIVFWPEGAMTFFLDDEPIYRAAIGTVLAPAGAELLAGGARQEARAAGARYFNSVFLLGPDAEVKARYDKQRLVPFGEYFPLRSVGSLRRRFEPVRSFSPGRGAGHLPTRLGLAGIAMCNEAMLPEVVAGRVAEGADFLVNPSYDSWIPGARFAEQQLDIVSVRAIEHGLPLVRASTSGPSALIDARGRVVARTALGERRALIGDLPAAAGPTPYTRVGDAFGSTCLALVALALVWSRPHGAS
jgi:apolipoprotein N-acyltransferase